MDMKRFYLSVFLKKTVTCHPEFDGMNIRKICKDFKKYSNKDCFQLNSK